MMVPLTIKHAGGTRVVKEYTVGPENIRYANRSEPNILPDTPTIKWGDKLPNPASYDVTVTVQAASMMDAANLAYDIAREAETATEITTHQGTRRVNGIMGYHVQPLPAAGASVLLNFAPTYWTTQPRLAYVTRNSGAQLPTDGDWAVIAFLAQSGYDVTLYDANVPDVPDIINVTDVIFVSYWAHPVYLAPWVSSHIPLVLANAAVLVEAGMATENKTGASISSVTMMSRHMAAGQGYGVGNSVALTTSAVNAPFADPATLGVGENYFLNVAQSISTRAHLVAGYTWPENVNKVLVPIGMDSGTVWTFALRQMLLASLKWVLT